MEKVTQTYELLEHILNYFDPHLLRRARLVDTYWHSIIHNSSVLTARLRASQTHHSVRTVLVGVGGAGKDSLVSCLLRGPVRHFPYEHDPAWEPSFATHVNVDHETWLLDGLHGGPLGQGRHSHYLGQFLANSETYMLVYSTSSRHGFDKIKAWMAKLNSPTEPLSMLVSTEIAQRKQRLDTMRLERCMPAAVVSTKNDLCPSLKEVDASEGAAFARELGCPFVETSAKTGHGVEAAFAEMCRTYKQARVAELLKRSKATSLLEAVPVSAAATKERRERWWRWYRAKQRRS